MIKAGVPVATPVGISELVKAAGAIGGSGNKIELFLSCWQNYFRVPHCYVISSARAALYITLKALKEQSARDEVIIPAFVCPSVAKSVVKAGLKLVPVDVSMEGFGPDFAAVQKVMCRETLAVIVAHLFGYPAKDLERIIDIADENGTTVIEDAAQAAGARCDGKYVGTLGDVGIYSLGMSKALSTMGGGVIVTKGDPLGLSLERLTASLVPRGRRHSLAILGKLFVYSVVTRSRCLGPLIRIWEKRFRGKDDLADFEVCGYSSVQAAVGISLLKRLDQINSERCNKARELTRNLAGIKGIRVPFAHEEDQPICLRYPVVVHDLEIRRRVLKLLRDGGINASELYSRECYGSIMRLATRRRTCPTTEYIMDRMVVLPTHFSVSCQDVSLITTIFRNACGSN